MLDPRIDDVFQRLTKLELALLKLAATVDGIAWREASEGERRSIDILEEIKETLMIRKDK